MDFRIQLKQGSKTYVERGEFKSSEHVLTFYNSLTTAKVTEIWGGSGLVYKDKTIPPIDDMNYYRLVKTFAINYDSQKSIPVYIRNVKLTKNSDEIEQLIKECMEIDGLRVDSILSTLFKPAFDS